MYIPYDESMLKDTPKNLNFKNIPLTRTDPKHKKIITSNTIHKNNLGEILFYITI